MLQEWIFLILVIRFNQCASIKKVSETEKTSEFWIENGKIQLKAKLAHQDITTTAKNIILFIGDGMGISTVTTARIYKNQRMVDSKSSDENLEFENLPNVGLSKTYCVNDYVCDSASTATAILTGIKTNRKVLGLSPKIESKNCHLYNRKRDDLKNIADYFFLQNKSLGIVTTASITDATPAAVYANIPNRSWKYKASRRCPFQDIASQLISKSKMFQVIFGGGRTSFMLKNETDPEYDDVKGSRKDINLITKWEKQMKGKSAKYIWNVTQFTQLQPHNIDHVLGLFEPRHMLFSDEPGDDPKLFEMTAKAIEILSQNKNGFFLLVEEGKIDKAHHANQAYRAILQTLDLEKAVKTALQMTDPKETLLIVTADHSHVMTLGGYVSREVDIMGRNGKAKDKRGYTSILYSNGPNYQSPRENITKETNFTAQSKYHAGIRLNQETHGGEEVTVYSRGPWSHLLRDIFEQSFIGHVMMYSSCSGVYFDRDGCFVNNSWTSSKVYLFILSCYFPARYYEILII